jgi:hypothetical protein
MMMRRLLQTAFILGVFAPHSAPAKADTIGQDVEEESTVLVETGEAFHVLAARSAREADRSRTGSRGAPLAILSLGSGGAVAARLHCGGQRFESPQLHQEVRANHRGFPAQKIIRRYGWLARLAPVCASPSPRFPA